MAAGAGDVIFVTLALFVWVLWLVEAGPGRPRVPRRAARPLRAHARPRLGAAAVVSMRPLGSLVAGHVHVTPDSLVFATLFAVAGAALPGELLFAATSRDRSRGGTVAGRRSRSRPSPSPPCAPSGSCPAPT